MALALYGDGLRGEVLPWSLDSFASLLERGSCTQRTCRGWNTVSDSKNSSLLSQEHVPGLQLGNLGMQRDHSGTWLGTYCFELDGKLGRKDFLKVLQELREGRARVMLARGADLEMTQGPIL